MQLAYWFNKNSEYEVVNAADCDKSSSLNYYCLGCRIPVQVYGDGIQSTLRVPRTIPVVTAATQKSTAGTTYHPGGNGGNSKEDIVFSIVTGIGIVIWMKMVRGTKRRLWQQPPLQLKSHLIP